MAYGKVDGLHCPRCQARWDQLSGTHTGGAPDMFTQAAPLACLVTCAACGNGWLRVPAPYRGAGNVDGLTGGAPPAWESMGAPRPRAPHGRLSHGWQGAALPTLLAVPMVPMVERRNPAQAARGAYRVTVVDSLRDSDGWAVWQGAAPATPRRLTLHTVAGVGPTRPRSLVDGGTDVPMSKRAPQVRTDHLAFCTAQETHTVGRRKGAPTVVTQCQETGKGGAWVCPTHGATSTVGATLPRSLDGKRVRVVHTVEGRKGEHDGKQGIACVPAPTAPVMGAYAWAARRTAPTVDGGAVLLYGWSVLDGGRVAPHGLPDMTALRDGGYLLDVRTRTGATRKGAPRKRSRAALVARDARAATLLDAQAARRKVTARSSGAAIAREASKRAARAARVAALRDSLVTV